MGKTTGFIEYRRSLPVLRRANERVGNWDEFHAHLPEDEIKTQGARCMNCGIPFCHHGQSVAGMTTGCPLHNLIPEWNDLVYRGRWREAYERLALTNNFPEFTGRVCPAPCELSCVLGINEEPVAIKEIEAAIIDRAFDENWITPQIPSMRTGKKVAVIGSGPAGLACADDLNRRGHFVTVFERADRIGGLLIYGIPNMKLEKRLVERRVKLLADEGIEFRTNINIGTDVCAADLQRDFDAIVLTVGATAPRDLEIEGRNLRGVYPAMDYLSSNTKSLLDSGFSDGKYTDVRGKNVVVIGGGDTGTDCVGSSLRHGCQSLLQLEIAGKPSDAAWTHQSWLARARTFQTDYGQEEAVALNGGDPREFNIATKRFVGDADGNLIGIETVEIEQIRENDKVVFREIVGSEKVRPAEAVFLAMGFIGAEKNRLFEDLNLEMTERQTVKTDEHKRTNIANIFAAGDCERGQSLVVWAMADGKKAAQSVDGFLGMKDEG